MPAMDAVEVADRDDGQRHSAGRRSSGKRRVHGSRSSAASTPCSMTVRTSRRHCDHRRRQPVVGQPRSPARQPRAAGRRVPEVVADVGQIGPPRPDALRRLDRLGHGEVRRVRPVAQRADARGRRAPAAAARLASGNRAAVGQVGEARRSGTRESAACPCMQRHRTIAVAPSDEAARRSRKSSTCGHRRRPAASGSNA